MHEKQSNILRSGKILCLLDTTNAGPAIASGKVC